MKYALDGLGLEVNGMESDTNMLTVLDAGSEPPMSAQWQRHLKAYYSICSGEHAVVCLTAVAHCLGITALTTTARLMKVSIMVHCFKWSANVLVLFGSANIRFNQSKTA